MPLLYTFFDECETSMGMLKSPLYTASRYVELEENHWKQIISRTSGIKSQLHRITATPTEGYVTVSM